MNVTNSTSPVLSTSITLIDSIVYDYFLTFNLLVVCYIVGVFGIAANVINIINFKKQGFQDGVNVTLTALAVSDLGALVSLLTTNIIVNPWYRQADMMIVKTHLFAIFFYIHEYFMRVGGVITSFAAFERCLCVVLPLKVKKIVTKNVALVVNCTIFLVISLYLFPPFNVIYFDSKFIVEVNRTLFSMFFKSNRESYMSVYYFAADMFIPYATFFTLLVCTAVLIRKLTSQTKWRQSTSNADTYKERKLFALLITISLLFISCTIPQAALTTAIVLKKLQKYSLYRVMSTTGALEMALVPGFTLMK
ncbi:hypothetical protein Btru_019951 [Bulinus truncatus]|nr:hypothetical protein Btru_019951 [Bulinus truncatus]